MQADRKVNHRRPWMWVGFGIGLSISLLAYFGIDGVLFLIEQFQVPEEQLAVFTSLFYGVVFFIALGGVRTESRRHKMLVTTTTRAFEAPSPPVSGSRKTMERIRTVSWYIFGLFSLGWLTPALIIYWAEPKHPDWAVSVCAYLFSLVAGTVYVLKREEKIKTGYNCVILYVGVCLGAFLVDRIAGVFLR